MVLPVVDEQLQQIGGIAFDLIPAKLFSQLFQQFGKDFTLIYLVSLDGVLIMHPYTVTANQLPLYIYNETITGFTQEDWERMNNSESKSNCTDFSSEIKFKCVYNSYFQKNMLASVQKLDQFNVSVIVIVSSSEFNKFQKEFNYSVLENLYFEFKLQMCEQFGVFVLLSFFIILITTILFFPIELIILNARNQIQKIKRRSSNLSFCSMQLLSLQIIELYQSCQHLNKLQERFSFSKSEQCQLIENYEYPIRQSFSVKYLIEHYGFLKLKVFLYFSTQFRRRGDDHNFELLQIVQDSLKRIKR